MRETHTFPGGSLTIEGINQVRQLAFQFGDRSRTVLRGAFPADQRDILTWELVNLFREDHRTERMLEDYIAAGRNHYSRNVLLPSDRLPEEALTVAGLRTFLAKIFTEPAHRPERLAPDTLWDRLQDSVKHQRLPQLTESGQHDDLILTLIKLMANQGCNAFNDQGDDAPDDPEDALTVNELIARLQGIQEEHGEARVFLSQRGGHEALSRRRKIGITELLPKADGGYARWEQIGQRGEHVPAVIINSL